MRGILLHQYAPVVEIRRNKEGKILRGLALGDILRQNQALILLLHRGELKERPALGCGIEDMLLDNDPIYWRSLIREQLETDGQKVNKITLTTTGITIDANY